MRDRETVMNAALKDLWPHLEKGGYPAETAEIKSALDLIDAKITSIKLSYQPILDEFSRFSSSVFARQIFPSATRQIVPLQEVKVPMNLRLRRRSDRKSSFNYASLTIRGRWSMLS